MQAVVLREFGPPDRLLWESVPAPRPAPDEALLRVRAVCVSLFHTEFRSGRALQAPLPRILGSGPSGEVAEVGSAVTSVRVGARVVVCNNVSCGECRYCLRGRETLCAGLNGHRGGMIGVHRDGGYAEYVAVPARNLVVLPDAVSFEAASFVPTTIGPVTKACAGRARIRPGDAVVVVGAGGGMGLHAVQMARACGGRVIAALRGSRRAEAARAAGADEVVMTGEADWYEAVRRLTGGWGADALLDFVATRETLQAGIRALAPGGRLVIMGYFPRGGVLETSTWPFTEEIEVTGNRSAGRNDIAQALTLIGDGRLRPIVNRTLPLREAAEAHRALEAGEVTGRDVLVP